MNYEFLTSVVSSFGISIFLAIILIGVEKSIQFMKKNNKESDKEEIKSTNFKNFDQEIIDLTRERLNQEIQISSAIETKAGILIGSIGVIFTIIISNGLLLFLKFSRKRSLQFFLSQSVLHS
jgi:predicted PurR-regulated permease PerM